MNKIIVLDQNTANQIAAGEVVERPMSIVKEMIENSIDANASKISIEIKKGGIEFIKISDNGVGIPRSDCELAFERHATSKITCIDDLFSVETMGFRGEALASIAAVSEVELISRTLEDSVGYKFKIIGGEPQSIEDFQCNVGTTFIIKNLFYNTPARYKFLKKDSTEAAYISDVVSRIALGHPEISFTLTGATQAKTPTINTNGNDDLKSVIYNIYGREVANNLIHVNFENDTASISGYVGEPIISKATRNNQTIILNGRYIKNRVISTAVEEAFKTRVMKNKFPFFCLSIVVPSNLVDVNVHPAKTEVRFKNEQEIFQVTYRAVLSSLNAKIEPLSQQNGSVPKLEEAVDVPKQSTITNTNTPFNVNTSNVWQFLETIAEPIKNVEIPVAATTNVQEKSYIQQAIQFENEKLENTAVAEIDLNNKQFAVNQHASINVDVETISKVHDSIKDVFSSKYKTQLFYTYLIFENTNVTYAVDQHAAHDRINYERLLSEFEKSEISSQQILMPITISLSSLDFALYNENSSYFKRLGFDCENFGETTIIVRGIPTTLDYNSTENAIHEIINKISVSNTVNNIVNEYSIYTIACKCSIKANSELNENEAIDLINQLSKTNNPYNCPHGRPTIQMIDKYQFEKLFKRIV